MVYEITLIEKAFWKPNKKIKKVKGHLFPKDMPEYMMFVILEDESRMFINLNEYKQVRFSKELFMSIAKKAERESNGQAKVT